MGLRQASVWSLSLDGKLETPGWLNTVTPGVLVHVMDQLTWPAFSVGHGGSLQHHSSFLQLKLWGLCFKWTFLQSEVQMSILGINFLRGLWGL